MRSWFLVLAPPWPPVATFSTLAMDPVTGEIGGALAILIVKKNCGVWLNNDVVLRLQVDDNPEPIKELRRLVEHPRANARPRGC